MRIVLGDITKMDTDAIVNAAGIRLCRPRIFLKPRFQG